MFDKAAATWDEKPIRVLLAQKVAEAIKRAVPLNRQMNVLEIGCGTGLIAVQLAGDVHSVLATDTSEGMLAVVKEKIISMELFHVDTMCLDVCSDDLGLSGTFHLIYSSMTLHHIDDTETVLRKCREFLGPDGILAIADLEEEDGSFHGDMAGVKHHGFNTEKLADLAVDCGFKDITFDRAHVLSKEDSQGMVRDFPVFLMTARAA